MSRNLPPKLAQGQAGVYAVAAQLLLRGVNPSFPAVDRGADIITDWGTRIQVKSGHRRPTIYGGSYHFCLDSGVTMYTGGDGYKKGKRQHSRKFDEECDFFAMWGIDDNRFWVIPSPVLNGRTVAIMVGASAPFLYLDRDALKADFQRGMSRYALADKYRIARQTVVRIISGNDPMAKNTEFCKLLLSHENRWELITESEQLLSQGDAIMDSNPAAAMSTQVAL